MNHESIDRIPITVLILTKNEELAVQKCIKSVLGFDQIIVVDSNSSDRTVEISSELGSEIVQFSWDGKYPKKKEWAMRHASIRNDWVLFLDADEQLSSELCSEIRSLFTKSVLPSFGAYDIQLQYHFMNRELKFGHRVVKRALLNRNYCEFPEIDDLYVSNMWEVEGHYQPDCKIIVGKLKGKIIHLDPDPLYDYFARHNRYSDWEAELRINAAMRNTVNKSRSSQGKFFDLVPFKPFVFFIYSFFIRNGWLDGQAGFDYALALSFYYFQVSLKAREKGRNEKSS